MAGKFILILTISLIITSCKTYDNLNDNLLEETSQLYEITRIRKTNVGYIIYARKGDLRYQIISSRNERDSENCNRLRRRKVYDLDLVVVHPSPDMVPNLAIVMRFGRLNLPLRKKYHYRIYKANNLNGLCIINKDISLSQQPK